jgi:predicted nucleic acid-binding protein
LAPDLLIYEVANILYKRMHRNELTLSEASAAFNIPMHADLNFEALTNERLSLKALDIASQYTLPATCDAHYLALAEREQCKVLDRRRAPV